MNITKIIAPIKLLAGSHTDTWETGQGCFMNVIAYLNGEPQITDQSECVCITVRPMAIFLNDLANNEQRQRMVPLILRALGSTTDDKVEIERRLALLVEFAQWQAELAAESATDSAKYAASTEYAAKSAEYAAKHAAMSAKHAAKYAEFAAKSAASTEYAAYQAVTFNRGLILLDAMLPALVEADAAVIARAQKLAALTAA